jgi:hypothetical protein
MCLAASIAGCGSSKPRGAAKPKLRGVPVRTFECPPDPKSPDASATRIVAVQTLLLCPLRAPGAPAKAVTISKQQAQFASLLAALSVPDEASTTAPCPAYADLPQFVLAKTSQRAYQVSIPVDACRHYQKHALEALDRARRGAT